MNGDKKNNEPQALANLKAFIKRKENQIVYNLAQKQLNLMALFPDGLETLTAREDSLLSLMENLESEMIAEPSSQKNVETASKELEYLTSSQDDVLQGVGVMLPKGSSQQMREANKKREEEFLKSLKEKPIRDRIREFFRGNDNVQDRSFLDELESFNRDLDFRTKYPDRKGQGQKTLNPEFSKALQVLMEQAKAGRRS